uniref:Uncharacterized protein n=1 Tax=Solanum lycopersicum TaxID=4081 RepID=A0A3Q7IXH8_SOLLC
MEIYLREETNIYGDDESKKMILQASISCIKRNTSEIELDSDFTAEDYCLQVVVYIEKILKTQRVPIIVGGCFIWIDVQQSVLNRRVDMRVDQVG